MTGQASSPPSEGARDDPSGWRAAVLAAVRLFGALVVGGVVASLSNHHDELSPSLVIADLFGLAYGAGLMAAAKSGSRRGLRIALALLLGLAVSARRERGEVLAVVVVCLCLAAALALALWIETPRTSEAAPGALRAKVSFYSEAANVAAGAFIVGLLLAASSTVAAVYRPLGARPSFEVRAAQRSVVLTGGLYPGTAFALRNVLDSAPGVATVVLESTGGLIMEGEALSELISTRGLNTRVSGQCLSACTFALMGGMERTADPGAKIGFHASRKVPGAKPGTPAPTPEEIRVLYRSFGVSAGFAAKVAATPSDSMWYPSREELVAEGILSDPGLAAPSSSARTARSRHEVAGALRTDPALDALALRYPEEFRQLVDKAWAKVQASASDAEIRAAARERIDFLADRLVVDAPDSLVLDYAALTFEQAEALRANHPTGCLQVLFPTGKPGTPPRAFVARKEHVLGRMLRSQDTPKRAAKPKWKSEGRAAARQTLTRLTQAQRDALVAPEIALAYPARSCEAGLAVAQALEALPAAERAEALRALFGTGEALLRPDWDATVQEIAVGRAIRGEQSVLKPTTRFGPLDTFAVFVTLAGGIESVTVAVRFTDQAANLVSKNRLTVDPARQKTSQFYVWMASGWDVGRYKVAVTLDGKPMGSRTFEVVR